MKKVDISQTMTKVLFEKRLPAEAFESIGKNFAIKKLALSKEFLPDLNTNWYDQMINRFSDLASWVRGAEQFPNELKEAGLAKLNAMLEQQKDKFSQINRDNLFPLIDCNSENLVVLNGVVSYIDAYPPKESWRIGSLDVDIFRAGSDIYALAGKEEFDAFMKGIYSEAEHLLDKELHDFYLLYGAMVMGPYFYMLSEKEPAFLEKAKKYEEFIENLI